MLSFRWIWPHSLKGNTSSDVPEETTGVGPEVPQRAVVVRLRPAAVLASVRA